MSNLFWTGMETLPQCLKKKIQSLDCVVMDLSVMKPIEKGVN